MRSSKTEIGIVGAGVMGSNLAMNCVDKGYKVVLYDLDVEKVHTIVSKTNSKNLLPSESILELVESLDPPRVIILLINAGPKVDELIEQFLPLLNQGDILADGGNSHYTDTEKRYHMLKLKGIEFAGIGISGGAKGAREGASFMLGSSFETWNKLEPILSKISAYHDGAPCMAWFGTGGAGHYVKMVHNGIEYAVMEIIAEAYHLLKNSIGNMHALITIFREWKDTKIDSYLIGITHAILTKVDDESADHLINLIDDRASQKGTGMWTSQSALELGISVSGITEAVEQRMISSFKSKREVLSNNYEIKNKTGGKELDISKTADGLYCGIILAHIQGFTLINIASKQHEWDAKTSSIIQSWQNGSILRSTFLANLGKEYVSSHESDLLLQPFIKDEITKSFDGLKYLIKEMININIPSPTLSSLYNYFLSVTSKTLPTNIIQAQRDYFGSHGFTRIDKKIGVLFHGNWEIETSEK